LRGSAGLAVTDSAWPSSAPSRACTVPRSPPVPVPREASTPGSAFP